MAREKMLIKQYEIFSERKLHFGRLFWQIPTIFIGLCIFVASIIDDLGAPAVWWFVLISGFLMILIAYIGYRLMANEDKYESLMHEIENELERQFGNRLYHSPLSKKFGARFATSTSLLVIGIILIVMGAFNVFR